MSERQADGIWKNVLILDQDDFKILTGLLRQAREQVAHFVGPVVYRYNNREIGHNGNILFRTNI